MATTAAASGTVALVAHQTRFDLLAFIRDRRARIFTILMPVLMLVLLVGMFGHQRLEAGPGGLTLATVYVPGVAAVAIIGACLGSAALGITAQREMGVLKRRRSSPVSAWVLVVGQSLTYLALAMAMTAIVIALGAVAFGVSVSASALPGVVLTAAVGAVSFCCMGYALSTAMSSVEAAGAVQAILFPLYFISGIWVPDSSLPTWLHDVAMAFPIQHLAHGLRQAFVTSGSSGIVWGDLAVMAAWGLVGLVIAVRRFSWLPKAGS